MNVIVRQPGSLPHFAYQEMPEGARFETPTAPETIGLDLLLSFRSQSLTDELEADQEPIRTDGTP